MDEYESLSHTKWECKIPRDLYPEVPTQGVVWATARALGRDVPQPGCPEAEPDRGRAPDVRSCAYDDRDSAQVCGVAGGGIYQGQERDSFSADLWGAKP